MGSNLSSVKKRLRSLWEPVVAAPFDKMSSSSSLTIASTLVLGAALRRAWHRFVASANSLRLGPPLVVGGDDEVTVILFYKYKDIAGSAIALQIRETCARFSSLRGRCLVAAEGINGVFLLHHRLLTTHTSDCSVCSFRSPLHKPDTSPSVPHVASSSLLHTPTLSSSPSPSPGTVAGSPTDVEGLITFLCQHDTLAFCQDDFKRSKAEAGASIPFFPCPGSPRVRVGIGQHGICTP